MGWGVMEVLDWIVEMVGWPADWLGSRFQAWLSEY